MSVLPAKIGRYDIVRIAGSGGFATVYEGFDPRLDARVAIKVLADNWSQNPETRRRFRQEAVILRRLGSQQGVPDLVEVFDIDETETGQPFLVMGWANRGTLAQRAGRDAWESNQLVPVVHSLTQSLGHLHAAGVVHRDIKPQNLLLRADDDSDQAPSDRLLRANERLVLGDFGLAKDLDSETSALSLIAGTERYMAPEQLVYGGSIDHRADIYSATAMIAGLLRGRGQTQPVLGDELEAVITKGTAHSRDDRYQNMHEWQTAFTPALMPREPKPNADKDTADLLESAESATRIAPSASAATPTQRASAAAPVHRAPAQPVSAPLSSNIAPVSPIAPAFPPASDVATVPDTTMKRRSLPLSLLVVGLVAALVIGLTIFTRSTSPILGPGTIESGETATYTVDGASLGSVRWTDTAGQTTVADSLEITGRLPGRLTFSATVDGQESSRTIDVEPSDQGPRIVGPSKVGRGEQGIYTASVPVGHTFYWIHPTRGRVTESQLAIVQQGTDFVVGVISVDPSGLERGDQMLVTD